MNNTNIQRYFFNPREPKSANILSDLLSRTILELAKIYSGSQATENKVFSDIDNNPMAQTVRKLLEQEAETRLFNHKFMGQIHPQGNMIAIIAKTIAGFMNNNTIVEETSPIESKLETEVTTRIAKWFGYNSKTFAANITSGGTTANLNALWVARKKAESLNKPSPYYILTNEMRHYSIDKIADIMGSNVHTKLIPTHGFQTDLIALEQTIQKIHNEEKGTVIAIVGMGGETETGEIDDFNALADISEKYGSHLHVDAAYGGPFILSRARNYFNGIDRADSITIDPHKMLYTPYSSGLILFKNRTDQILIESSMKDNARYLVESGKKTSLSNENRNLGMTRVEGSMGSEGVMMTWATLELLGEEGIAEILNHTLDLTECAYRKTSKSKTLSPLHKPMINTLLIGLRNSNLSLKKYNQAISKMQKYSDQHGYYVSINTDVDSGYHALRFVAMHPHTSKKM